MDSSRDTIDQVGISPKNSADDLQVYSFVHSSPSLEPFPRFEEVVLEEGMAPLSEPDEDEAFEVEAFDQAEAHDFTQRVAQGSCLGVEKKFNRQMSKLFNFDILVNTVVSISSGRIEERLCKYVRVLDDFYKYEYPLQERTFINKLKWALVTLPVADCVRLGKQYATRYPKSAKILYYYGLAQYKNKKWEKALQIAEKALRISSCNGLPGNLKGMCEYRLGDMASAAQSLAAIFPYYSRQPSFLKFVLPLFRTQKMIHMILQTVSALVVLYPEDVSLREELAMLCYEGEYFLRALSYLGALGYAEDYRSAICSAYLGKRNSARQKLAALLGLSGNSEYLTVLREAQKRYPADHKLSALVALYYYEEGAFKQAIGICEELQKKDPNGRVVLIMARCYLELDRVAEAKQALTDFQVQQESLRSLVALLRGIASYQEGVFSEAIHSLRIAKQDSETRGEANFFLGEIAAKEERFEDAVASFDRASRQGFKPFDSLIRLGYAALKANMLLVAEAAFRKVIVIDTECAEAYNNLGIIAARQGKYSKAGTQFKQALELDPENRDAHYNLGMVYEKILSSRSQAHLEKFVALEDSEEGEDTVGT